MPYRTVPLVNGETYHVFNRGEDHRTIFNNRIDYKRALEILSFYRFQNPQIKYSQYKILSNEEKKVFDNLSSSYKELVILLAYCLMPNHFHLLLRQEKTNGISRYLSNFQNSYTRYFNVKSERTGHLFQGQFKAVRIVSESQLLHVSRYIHLNPYTSYIVKNLKNTKNYEWSSLSQYIEKNPIGICNTKIVLSKFPSRKKYLGFVNDQKNYQRKLNNIKHLLLE